MSEKVKHRGKKATNVTFRSLSVPQGHQGSKINEKVRFLIQNIGKK